MEILVIFFVGLFLLSRVFKNIGRMNRRSYRRVTYPVYNPMPEVVRKNLLGRDELSPEERGARSEQFLISSLIDYGISPQAIFHNLILKSGKGRSSQIDIAVATRVGIIVFEVKDYSGWIFGKGKQDKWTQVISYGYRYIRTEKYRFYNPVLQNESHIRVLQQQSKQFQNLPFYSVIVFDGDCELRDISFIPKGTFVIKPHRLHDVLDAIFENEDANYTDKREVMRILKTAVANGNDTDTQIKHVENIKDMLGKDRVLD